MNHLLLITGLLLGGAQAQASQSALKVTESGSVRDVDCAGRDLIVTGDNDKLAVSGCVTISIVGSRNQVAAKLLPDSTIAALGDHNHIVFTHAPGIEVQVSSTGKGNEIVPDMGRDLKATLPVHFPIAH